MDLPDGIEETLEEHFENSVQRRYRHYVKIDDLENLTALMELSGVEPEVYGGAMGSKGYICEMDARDLYKRIIESQPPYVQTLERLETWKGLLGVEMKQMDVDMAFCSHLKKGHYGILLRWWDELDAEPDKWVVNKGYKIFLKKRDFEMLEKWQDKAGVGPEEEMVQHAYGMYIMHGDFVAVTTLKELVDIEPCNKNYLGLVASVSRPPMPPHGHHMKGGHPHKKTMKGGHPHMKKGCHPCHPKMKDRMKKGSYHHKKRHPPKRHPHHPHKKKHHPKRHPHHPGKMKGGHFDKKRDFDGKD